MFRNLPGLLSLVKLRFILIVLSALVLTGHAFAWNHNGHRLVAKIAWAEMTPIAREKAMIYLRASEPQNRHLSFVSVAPWLDTVDSYKKIHYITIPFSKDGRRLKEPAKPNIVTAMANAVSVLQDSRATPAEKGLQLKILIHLMADIYQPMHAVSYFSRQNPYGDRGGNFYPLGKNRVAKNLHSYWDRGGGLLIGKQHYPANLFICRNTVEGFHPNEVAMESHKLAINSAYAIKRGQRPSAFYRKNVQTISMKRLNQAGCQLGKVLNQAL